MTMTMYCIAIAMCAHANAQVTKPTAHIKPSTETEFCVYLDLVAVAVGYVCHPSLRLSRLTLVTGLRVRVVHRSDDYMRVCVCLCVMQFLFDRIVECTLELTFSKATAVYGGGREL